MKTETYGEVLVSAEKLTSLFNDYLNIVGVDDIFLDQVSRDIELSFLTQTLTRTETEIVVFFGIQKKAGIVLKKTWTKPASMFDNSYQVIQDQGDFYELWPRFEYRMHREEQKLPEAEFVRVTQFAKDFQGFALKKVLGLT